MILLLENYNSFKNFNLAYVYQFLFASILPVAVFIPIWLPIIAHFMALTFLYEMAIVQMSFGRVLQDYKKLFYCLNIFSLICFLSVLTAIAPRISLRGALHVTQYINLGFLMYCGAQVTTYKPHILKGFWIGFIIGLCFGFIESYSQGSVKKTFYTSLSKMYKYNKFTSVLMLLLPLLWISSFKKLDIFSDFIKKNPIHELLIKFLLTILSVYIVFNLSSDTSKLALIVNLLLLSFLMCHFISFKFKKKLVMLLLCLCFLAPLVITSVYKIPEIQNMVFRTFKKGSFYDRLSVWDYVQNISLNKGSVPRALPQHVFGFGINSSKLKCLSSQQRPWLLPIKTLDSFQVISVPSQGIPLHPHNFVLQIWLELGYFGVLLAFILLTIYIYHLFSLKIHFHTIVASVLSLFSFLIIASMGYGIWQSWWLSTLIITLTLTTICQKNYEG